MSDALFNVDAPAASPDPTEGLSADRRRTLRQTEALTLGRHPLELALGWPLRLHAEAAPPGDREAGGRRCGNCRFRRSFLHNDYRHAKCAFQATDDTVPRLTRGAGTDVRAWWPACSDHEVGDPALPDAMRWVPDPGVMQ